MKWYTSRVGLSNRSQANALRDNSCYYVVAELVRMAIVSKV